jgi:[acyl-carrier-protein] S-malonyltransferase
MGVTHLIACVPGKVLAGMIKRIDADAISGAIFDPASLLETRNLLS